MVKQLHLSENQVFDATLFAQVQRETLKRVEDESKNPPGKLLHHFSESWQS